MTTRCLRLLLSLCIVLSTLANSPSFVNTDFDSYGVKITANDIFAVQVVNLNNGQSYVNAYLGTKSDEDFCAWYVDETAARDGGYTFFVYGTHVGRADTLVRSLIYWGENYGGSWNDSHTPAQMSFAVVQHPVIVDPSLYLCSFIDGTVGTNDGVMGIAPITVSNEHEEFFQAAIEPRGNHAVAIANGFGFIWNLLPLSQTPTYVWQTASNSPLYQAGQFDFTFGPRAIGLESSWGVVAGWVQNTQTKVYSAVVILFAHWTGGIRFVDRWEYKPDPTSWQSRLRITEAGTFLPQHSISVAVRDDGKVAVGIEQFNSVFLFQINTTDQLYLIGQKEKAIKMIGFGKSVSFTNHEKLAVLYNKRGLDYENVDPSSVELYPIEYASAHLPAWGSMVTPAYIFPNPTQTVNAIRPTFIAALTTPNNLFILDSSTSGNTQMVRTSDPGYYQPTAEIDSEPLSCPAGMHKSVASFESCKPCEAGTMNNGSHPAAECDVCPAGSFCPLGAVTAVSNSWLSISSQGFVYPSNPDNTVFDDVLMQNMFQLHGGAQCVATSPVFWGLLVLGFNFIIAVAMVYMRYFLKDDTKARDARRLVKFCCRRADLAREGEHWVGGLVSLVGLCFIIMAFWFASVYIQQYPFETAPNPEFGCEKQFNAKFMSSLTSVALPPTGKLAPIYDMLGQQPIHVTLEVINTETSCADIEAEWVRSIVTPLIATSCSTRDSTTSLTVALPSHTSDLRFTVSGSQLIGAFRLTFTGRAATKKVEHDYQLLDMLARQSFSSANQTLQKAIQIPVSLIRVINVTEPLETGDPADIDGVLMPVFPTAIESFFMNEADYPMSPASDFVFDVVIDESEFYVVNRQDPIVRTSEAAFKTLLYVMMILECLGLIFLICKLFQPFAYCFGLRVKRRSMRKVWDNDDCDDEVDWIDDILGSSDHKVRPFTQTRSEKYAENTATPQPSTASNEVQMTATQPLSSPSEQNLRAPLNA